MFMRELKKYFCEEEKITRIIFEACNLQKSDPGLEFSVEICLNLNPCHNE